MSSEDIEQGSESEEDMGYDVPFVTYTWQQWQEMQVQALLSFTRFQRAIEQRRLQLALSIAVEMQELGSAMQKEVAQWIGVPRHE